MKGSEILNGKWKIKFSKLFTIGILAGGMNMHVNGVCLRRLHACSNYISSWAPTIWREGRRRKKGRVGGGGQHQRKEVHQVQLASISSYANRVQTTKSMPPYTGILFVVCTIHLTETIRVPILKKQNSIIHNNCAYSILNYSKS